MYLNMLNFLLSQVNLANHSMMLYYVYPEMNENSISTFVQHFDHIQLTSQPIGIITVHS